MILRIVTGAMRSLMRVKNVDDLFNSECVEKRYFCIFENISWVREYLTHLVYFGIFRKL